MDKSLSPGFKQLTILMIVTIYLMAHVSGPLRPVSEGEIHRHQLAAQLCREHSGGGFELGVRGRTITVEDTPK